MSRHHRSPMRLFRRRLRHAWRGITGRELNPPKWVFVLGCYNSGTTLLANLLSQHPQLNTLPREGVELTDSLVRPEQFGWPRMWRNCLPEMRAADQKFASTSHGRARRIKKQWSHFVSDEAAIVEKSPPNVIRAPFLQEHFQPAYFIHIVRNGYAVAEGMRRKASPGDWGNRSQQEYSIEDCAAQWADSEQMMAEHADKLDRCLHITYEELTENFAATLAKISDFLQIDAFPEGLAERQWDIHKQTMSISNMNAAAMERLSEDDCAGIRSVAGATLDKYGYQHES